MDNLGIGATALVAVLCLIAVGCSDDASGSSPADVGVETGAPDVDDERGAEPDVEVDTTDDQCPDDPEKEAPGICGCGVADLDADSDGTRDCVDECPGDAAKTVAGLCGCGAAELDSDNDGTPDCVDACPDDAEKTSVGICGCGQTDWDSDGDGTADCLDECPTSPEKTSRGVCGCELLDTDTDADGVADCVDGCPNDPEVITVELCGECTHGIDSDSDGVDDCDDRCNGFDDGSDADGDTVPDGCDGDLGVCAVDGDCDDGLECTVSTCAVGLCSTSAAGMCDWPAESPFLANNITDIEPLPGEFTNELHSDLSGAVWNPISRKLWVARNNGPAKVWVIAEDGQGSYAIDYKGNARGEWGDNIDFGDLEALTFVDFADTELLYLLDEGSERIRAYNFAAYDDGAAVVGEWNLGPSLPNTGGGAEGLTFVPDAFLVAQGFTDESGTALQSSLGMGGLMFVGHQIGGIIYVFDLEPGTGEVVHVATFFTSAQETAGLEFNRSTGLLFIWHGGNDLNLEVTRLSSSPDGGGRRLDTVKIYDGPGATPGSDNLEGFAVVSNLDCLDGERSAFLTNDGGNFWSLLHYRHFPCEL